MKALLPFLLLPLLMACDGLPQLDENGNIVQPPPPPPPPLPANVQAAMQPGIPEAFVFKTAEGCYGVGIELSEPRSGRPLRDVNGNWVCDPGVIAPDLVVAEEPAPQTEEPA